MDLGFPPKKGTSTVWKLNPNIYGDIEAFVTDQNEIVRTLELIAAYRRAERSGSRPDAVGAMRELFDFIDGRPPQQGIAGEWDGEGYE